MKKLLVCFLILCTLATVFSACSKTEGETAPDGFVIADLDGDDFRLYIPSHWNLNTAYGIAGGYYNLSTQSTVSVVKYPSEEEEIGTFFASSVRPAIERLSTGEIVEEETVRATTLATLNAERYHLSASVDGKKTHFVYVIGEGTEAFYVFSFLCDDSLFETLSPDVEQMLDVFLMAEPYVSPNYARKVPESADAPKGMQEVSDSDVAYRFYVPDDWTVDRNEAVYSAKSPDGHACILVTPYLPDEEMSVASFFDSENRRLGTLFGDRIESLPLSDAGSLGGRQATGFDYLITEDGVLCHIREIAVAYKSMIYAITYTAKEEDFNLYADDLAAVLTAFDFR